MILAHVLMLAMLGQQPDQLIVTYQWPPNSARKSVDLAWNEIPKTVQAFCDLPKAQPTVGGPCWQEAAIQIDTTADGADVACQGSGHRLPQSGTWIKFGAQQPVQPLPSLADKVVCDGGCMNTQSAAPQAEAIDVPAAGDGKRLCHVTSDYQSQHTSCTNNVPTCADKSRILMHSEDGTHWCHKPQP